MVWGTFLEKNLPSSNGHLLVLRRVLRLARMLCAFMYRQNGDLAMCNRYLGNAQIEVPLILMGLPLDLSHIELNIDHNMGIY